MLPFLPEEKSNHIDFWSLTKNEGVRSLLKGDSPFHSRPAFLSRTRRPTTSETGRRARSSSRNWGGNRMQPALLIRWALQYRTARGGRGGRRPCPSYSQGGGPVRQAKRNMPTRLAFAWLRAWATAPHHCVGRPVAPALPTPPTRDPSQIQIDAGP